MNGAGSLTFSTRAQTDIRRITDELAGLQAQISSGTTARDLSGYGGESAQLLSARGMRAAVEAQSSLVTQLSSRLEVQALALRQAASGAGDLAQRIREAISAGDGRGVASELENSFSSVVSALNQTWNGLPLFAGDRLDGLPIVVTSLASLATAMTPADYFNESQRRQVVDLGFGPPIEIAAKASDISQGLFDAMRDLKLMIDANGGSLGQPLDSATVSSLLDIANRLNSAADTITNEEGRNGRLQTRFDEEQTRLSKNSDLLAKVMSDQSDADLADVSIRMNLLMSQYQAAAKAYVDLSKLSLLDYL